jgi:hypothetical protein
MYEVRCIFSRAWQRYLRCRVDGLERLIGNSKSSALVCLRWGTSAAGRSNSPWVVEAAICRCASTSRVKCTYMQNDACSQSVKFLVAFSRSNAIRRRNPASSCGGHLTTATAVIVRPRASARLATRRRSIDVGGPSHAAPAVSQRTQTLARQITLQLHPVVLPTAHRLSTSQLGRSMELYSWTLFMAQANDCSRRYTYSRSSGNAIMVP